jgi:hypothetical protein
MNKSCILSVAILMSSAAVAEESRAPSAVPQPRVRLDPNSRTAISAPKKAENGSSASLVVMSPIVVKSTVIAAEDPQQEKQPEGPFSPLHGGRVARKTIDGLQVEIGAWPYRNILWKSDRFKSDMKHVGTELLRVSW